MPKTKRKTKQFGKIGIKMKKLILLLIIGLALTTFVFSAEIQPPAEGSVEIITPKAQFEGGGKIIIYVPQEICNVDNYFIAYQKFYNLDKNLADIILGNIKANYYFSTFEYAISNKISKYRCDISYSHEGAQAHAIIASFYQTSQLQGIKYEPHIKELIENQLQNRTQT